MLIYFSHAIFLYHVKWKSGIFLDIELVSSVLNAEISIYSVYAGFVG